MVTEATPVGKTAREMYPRRRIPLPAVTVDSRMEDGVTVVYAWSKGDHPKNQICTAAITLSDRGVGELARALLDRMLWNWRPGDELSEDAWLGRASEPPTQ